MTWAETIAKNINEEVALDEVLKKHKEQLVESFILHKLELVNKFNEFYDAVNEYSPDGISMTHNEDKSDFEWKYNKIWMRFYFKLEDMTSKSLATATLRVLDKENDDIQSFSFELLPVDNILQWYLINTDEYGEKYPIIFEAEEIFKQSLKKYLP